MERDTQLKNLLAKGAETASAGFTESILDKINGLAPLAPYQPLISNTVKKAFIIAFASVVGLILLVCLLIKASQITFLNPIELPGLSPDTYYNVFAFIVSFWLVFSVNKFIQRIRLKIHY